MYRVIDFTGASSILDVSTSEEAVAQHLDYIARHGVVNLPEEPVVEELTEELDDMDIFQNLMRYKWLKGREKYARLGKVIYNENSLLELQKELLDFANYSMRIYWELNDKLEKLHEILASRKST